MFNPYMYQQPSPYQVIRVNGENGARAFNQIPPNSSMIVIDENEPIIYLLTTDGGGYKTVTAYDISPHVEAPAPNYADFNERLERLEALINESYATKSEQKQPYKPNSSNKTNNERSKP